MKCRFLAGDQVLFGFFPLLLLIHLQSLLLYQFESGGEFLFYLSIMGAKFLATEGADPVSARCPDGVPVGDQFLPVID